MRLMVLGLGLFLATGGVASVGFTPRPDCTIVGTNDRDFIRGTLRADVICGGAGPDYLSGDAGRDVLRGGPDRDVVVGGGDRDDLQGRRGDDRIFAIDGVRDTLWGGRGQDRCYADQRDVVRGCEEVNRSRVTLATSALTSTMTGTIGAAEADTSGPPCLDEPGCGTDQGG